MGEVVTALLRAGVDLDQVAEYPLDWWGGHADALPEERGRIPLSFSIVATRRAVSAGRAADKGAPSPGP
jgi:hypothetical protein